MPTPEQRYEEIARRLRTLQAAGELVCGPPVREEDIDAAEEALGFRLPEAYRRLLVEFGPLTSIRVDEIEDTGRPGRWLKRKVRVRSRNYMLAPGTLGKDDLVRVIAALRKSDLPLPPSLIPYQVTEMRVGRDRTYNYHCFDMDRVRNGEPLVSTWMPWFPGKESNKGKTFCTDQTMFDILDNVLPGRQEPYNQHTPYEELAARLRSEDCTDQFTYAAPPDSEDVARTEKALGVTLPESYKRFLADFGPADLGNPLLDVRPEAEQGIVRVTEEQRRARRALPNGLIPFALSSAWAGPTRFETSYVCFDYNRSYHGEPVITTWAPKSPRGDRREDHDQVFLDWLEERIRSAEENPSPPDDWRNNAGWDRYWRRVLKDDFTRGWEAWHPGHALMAQLDEMRAGGVSRILFAGNGISMEPHAFAHLGFDVTALDVSAAASEFVETFPITPEHLARFLMAFTSKWDGDMKMEINTYDEAKSLERVKREHVPGGRLSVVTADMFSYTPEEAFDVVYSRRSIQAFSEEDRRALARQFCAWLRPGGLCLVETMNLCMGGYDEEIEASFEGTGFSVNGPGKPPAPDEKTVVFSHGSG